MQANATKRLHKFPRDAKRIYEKSYYSHASSVVSTVTMVVTQPVVGPLCLLLICEHLVHASVHQWSPLSLREREALADCALLQCMPNLFLGNCKQLLILFIFTPLSFERSSSCSGVIIPKSPHQRWKHWTRVSLLLELISSAHPVAVPGFEPRTSDMRGERVTTTPPTHVGRI
ncbi:hypothetical protein CSKR_112259 [Clonorchis sinensis]|uniref:Uncharacterized protein n=1 Tax=Clonorchis sinensis TaxID=79923 RepID=A0A3R7D2X5_CLOSI|nr:hypothetical protein CSKR_112259 [Clonorchis sinensis]